MNEQVVFLLAGLVALIGLTLIKRVTGLSIFPMACAVLAEDRDTTSKPVGIFTHKVKGSTKIYAGGGVCLTTDGLAVPAADTAAYVFVGKALEQIDNSAGDDGDLSINVEEGIFDFDATGMADTNVGELAYVLDDHTVGVVGGSTNRVLAGVIVEVVSATQVYIDCRNVKTHALRTGATVAAVATADADATFGQPEADLVNELKTKVNALLTSLKAANIIKNA